MAQVKNKRGFGMREFFGFGGYTREPEGAFSWQHLVFVTSLIVIMTVLALFLGKRNRHSLEVTKNRVLKVAAFLIDGFELLKLVIVCVRSGDSLAWLSYKRGPSDRRVRIFRGGSDRIFDCRRDL